MRFVPSMVHQSELHLLVRYSHQAFLTVVMFNGNDGATWGLVRFYTWLLP